MTFAQATKRCTTCGEDKSLDEYGARKRKNGEPGLYAQCKACINASNKSWRDANPERFKATVKANYNPEKAYARVKEWRGRPGNRERKNSGERSRRKKPETVAKNAEYNRQWKSNPETRDKINERRRQRRRSDPVLRDKMLEAQREYYSRPEIIEKTRAKRKLANGDPVRREKFNARRRERYATDPDFLCSVKCRAMVVRVAQKASAQKDRSTHDILGYSAHDLRLRMECQFLPGMSWQNYGFHGWHIDHKKPIAAFLSQGITDLRTINSLCNLQPMWAVDNQKKSSAWPLVGANDNEKGGHLVAA